MKNQKKEIIPKNIELLIRLEAQHKELMLKYKEILNTVKQKQYLALRVALNEFTELITNHFIAERELYMYLELVVSNSDGTYNATRAEMKDIALSIRSVLNFYINIPVTNETADKFIADFGILGKDLLGRMRFEETHLFSDYQKYGI